MMQTNDDTYDLAGYVMRLQKDLSDYKHTAVVLQQRLVAAREECEALRAKLNGKEVLAVTSLQVAEHFEKEHYNVLRDIESVLSQVPENFVKTQF